MLHKNMVFEWEGRQYRLLHIADGNAALFRMDQQYCSIVLHPLQTLNAAEHDGALRSMADPYLGLRSCKLAGKAAQRRSDNYALIRNITDDISLIFSKKRMAEKVTSCAAKLADSDGLAGTDGTEAARDKKIQCQRIRLMRLLNCWFKKGQVPGALNPEFGQNRSRRYNTSGRKTADGSKSPTLTESMRSKMTEACRTHMLKKEPLSEKKAYIEFRRALVQNTPEIEEKDIPTQAQFHYHVRTEFKNLRQRAKARNSSIRYNKDVRALSGTTGDISRTIGGIYEIDSTPADVNLVAEDLRSHIVGRPTLYIVRDVFSGMITGFNVSFDPAQYKSAADALYCAITDKKKICEECGVEYRPEEWPVCGVPASIVADNGELESAQIEYFQNAFNVTVGNTAPYRADMKGTCEEAFKSLMQQMRSKLNSIPCKQTLRKAGGTDTRSKAVLTMREFKAILLDAVISVNYHKRCKAPGKLPRSVMSNSLSIWNWAKDSGRDSLMRNFDDLQLRMALLPRYKATISRDGVRTRGLLYRCDTAAEQGWFERGVRHNANRSCLMVIDPANVSSAWLIPDSQASKPEYWPCRLCDERFTNLTLYETEDYQKGARETERSGEGAINDRLGELSARQRAVLRSAKAAAKTADTGQSESDKLKDIPENRKTERITQEATHPRVPQSDDSAQPEAETEPDVQDENEDWSFPDIY